MNTLASKSRIIVPLNAVLAFLLMIMVNSCSMGTRFKNLLNAPVDLVTVHALDSVSIVPDVVRFSGVGENGHHTFLSDTRILGRHKDRPMWQANERGALTVSSGARVRILDFNFRGAASTDTLIIVEDGTLLLENCDIWNPGGSGIYLGKGSALLLKNVRFSQVKEHAIYGEPGVVRLEDCRMDLGGNTAILADSTGLFEAHRVQVSGTMGRGIELNGCNEVWLDSVDVEDSFEDGVHINDCRYVLLEHLKTAKNGRNGLTVSNSGLSGFMGVSAVGNLVSGLAVSDIDTLKMTRVELIGNADQGGILQRVGRVRLADMVIGHNAVIGLVLEACEQVDMRYSTFQANLKLGLQADALGSFNMSMVSFLHNGAGLRVQSSDTLHISRSILKENKGDAIHLSDGESLTFTGNTLINNVNALKVKNFAQTNLDSNEFSGNDLGMDLRLSGHLDSHANIWDHNKVGLHLSEVYAVKSIDDRWVQNSDHAVESMSVADFVLQGAIIRHNRNGILFNDVSSKAEDCWIDTNAGFGLKGLNSNVAISNSHLRQNVTALELGDGSGARITQCIFKENLLSVLSDANSDLSLSFSTIEGGGSGLVMEDYAQAEIISNYIDNLDGYAVEISGPNIQSVYMRQNVVANSGGIIKSKSRNGRAEIENNTFAGNTQSFKMEKGTIGALDHNIFHATGSFDLDIVADLDDVQWNCFGADTSYSGYEALRAHNMFLDPKFGENYFLTAESPCLNGGNGGQLIGALGVQGISRPKLKP
ncbi:MAG: right-handed parallel beta-helix repeat-containing protein [Candidatus Marinimicrobia bacterium]|nr:right-handed parallel beta-helix repeat-containing protein [Candidatus Neomarinimicrobiota bacterium]MCF7850163.1 right-handed parallel beta-helix repeat-containing protein [Candidatus Neomarinimicrobiota bacterium]MCF7905146.1 right-handed parallel beta-helix repeat-containing protein [Candidatus Neomarinimicrobiota bacterium]